MSNHHLFIDQYQWFLEAGGVPAEMPAGGVQMNAAYMATIDRASRQFTKAAGLDPGALIGYHMDAFRAYLTACIGDHIDHDTVDALIAAWKEKRP